MVLGACSGDDLEARDVSKLDGPLTDCGTSCPDENLGRVVGDFDGTFRVVRNRKGETVEEGLTEDRSRDMLADERDNVQRKQ